jgi:hypothetical protein
MDKPKINPALIAALEHFAQDTYRAMGAPQEVLFVHRDEKGNATTWSVQEACKLAVEVLDTEDLHLLKLKALQQGLKRYGLDEMYELIMKEKLV